MPSAVPSAVPPAGDRLMSSESLKRSRSNVSPVNEGDIDKRPCIDTLHESFSSLGDSDTAYNETTILEPDSESEVCRLHSTVLDPAGSDDPLDQSRQEMSIRDSLKEALKDPAVVQVLTNAITSSLRGEIRTLREALERKEEKIAELQDRVDSLEQYSRRNVNDDLTRERCRVAARARQLKRDKKVKDTWVRDGEIYVKKNDDSINKLSTSRQLDVFG